MRIGIGVSMVLSSGASQGDGWSLASLFGEGMAGYYPAGYAQSEFTMADLFQIGGAGFWGGGVYPPEFEIGHLFGPSTAGYCAGGYGVST